VFSGLKLYADAHCEHGLGASALKHGWLRDRQ
jgi:hypothetical protein